MSGEGVNITGGGLGELERNIYPKSIKTIPITKPLRTRPAIAIPFFRLSSPPFLILMSARREITRPDRPSIKPPNVINIIIPPTTRGASSPCLSKGTMNGAINAAAIPPLTEPPERNQRLTTIQSFEQIVFPCLPPDTNNRLKHYRTCGTEKPWAIKTSNVRVIRIRSLHTCHGIAVEGMGVEISGGGTFGAKTNA